jgi:uncharacterized protein (DUF1501 family)
MEVGFNLNFVNGAGWDSHNAAQRELHVLIRGLDHVVATLITDLENNKLLDKTLIVIATEFGRPLTSTAAAGADITANASPWSWRAAACAPASASARPTTSP